MTEQMDEKDACWLWLCGKTGLYQPQIGKLLKAFGSPEELFRTPVRLLRAFGEIPEAKIEDLIASRESWDYEKYMQFLKKKRIRFIGFQNEAYPEKLREIADPPYGLFVKGQLPDSAAKTAAVVGARSCSFYGRGKAAALGAMLAENNVQVISGLALGVDAAAQKAALQNDGKSFAVLGCGVDTCYPRENIALYEELTLRGGVLSEFWPGQKPLAWHFPFRNRIISALSDCVIVVEAKEKSGSLITADYAAEQGREVLAVPGRMEDVLSRGCNRLIAQGAGILCENEEVLRVLELPAEKGETAGAEKLGLAKRENMVYSGVDFREKSLDEICENTGLTRGETMEALVLLEIRGFIKETAKNHYVRVQMR